MATPVGTTVKDGVAVIAVDYPPVNALGPGVPAAISKAIEDAGRDPSVSAIVFMGAGKTFVAGADINTLDRAAWGDREAACDLHPLLATIEDCNKPVIMAIHGTALGGGLEIAMAGHFRVASPDALLGQPEVNLGIIPGAEGTQRLPRLVGVAKALDMCVTGKPLKAAEAHHAGLIDRVMEGDLTEGAVRFARTVGTTVRVRKTRERDEHLGTPDENAPLFAAARELAGRTRRRQIAPLKAIEAIAAATTLPFDEGHRRERELFFECVESEQAKALIHVFFAERAVTKVRGLPKDLPSRPITRVAVIGAGTMGGGIATACANAGLTVTVKDTTQQALDAGFATIRRNYDASVKRGRLTTDAAAERMARITPMLGYDGVATADLVIEAVFENLELKSHIFRELDAVAKPGAVLATNTSTLDIDILAAATSRPQDVVGLHFFSPANIMRLLEVVRGGQTANDVLATALALAKRLGKVPVVVANCRGFVGNRMMFPYMYEAQFLVEEGATPEQVDRALADFGMAMGIFAVDDMAGIDVAWRVRQELGHFQEPGVRRPLVADKLCELGRYGQKTGRGWYRYDEQRKATPDPEVIDLIRRTATAAGIPQRTIDDREIVERCLYALVNEGARIVADGSAQRASDIDVIYANGYGFPSWRGGPMFYADRVGLAAVYERIRQFERDYGDRWTPAPLLADLAASGKTFREQDREVSQSV
ncbi:MAG TPA: 3-hydroxyacyl-CoA dehydrogenase NAD-binding domain-containing protein [Vicinamibacterales bacterium]|nr:3-hydroxyacyl-CoA dehydrogenase NAD-binding domain-containing protein [Vicinamibacterales bacterium]